MSSNLWLLSSGQANKIAGTYVHLNQKNSYPPQPGIVWLLLCRFDQSGIKDKIVIVKNLPPERHCNPMLTLFSGGRLPLVVNKYQLNLLSAIGLIYI
jgi:hypothetical protein